jgi:hypothetical protein
MVGIVRNAEIKFTNEKALKKFENQLNNSIPHISVKKLKSKVKADGIVITRNEKHGTK